MKKHYTRNQVLGVVCFPQRGVDHAAELGHGLGRQLLHSAQCASAWEGEEVHAARPRARPTYAAAEAVEDGVGHQPPHGRVAQHVHHLELLHAACLPSHGVLDELKEESPRVQQLRHGGGPAVLPHSGGRTQISISLALSPLSRSKHHVQRVHGGAGGLSLARQSLPPTGRSTTRSPNGSGGTSWPDGVALQPWYAIYLPSRRRPAMLARGRAPSVGCGLHVALPRVRPVRAWERKQRRNDQGGGHWLPWTGITRGGATAHFHLPFG